MPDDYRISDLTTVSAISDADLMELSAVNPASDTGYSSMKMPITALASKLLGGTQYAADLQTVAKTIFGKTDFWDIDAMADAIYGLLNYPALASMSARCGVEEVNNLKWENAALKMIDVYQEAIDNLK